MQSDNSVLNEAKIAVYPGTFDPITNGHIDIVERALGVFDKVILAVAINSNKTTLFSQEERLSLAKQVLEKYNNVEVKFCKGLTVDFAMQEQATSILRGLRAVSDFEYEMQMALMNRKLQNKITTLFMMPNEKYTYLNSSIIRELAKYNADVSDFVPSIVAHELRSKILSKNNK